MANFALKAKMLARQGQSPEQIMETLFAEADATIHAMDMRLARFVDEATPEQIKWLNEDLGFDEVEGDAK